MLPSLLVAAAVTAPAAPIPRDTVPNTTGPAPRVVAVKADATGAVRVTATVYQKVKVQQQFFAVENGKQVLKQQEVEQLVSTYVQKTLAEFEGKFVTADGTVLSAEEATKRVKDGATLLVTADGKPVDRGWLRAVGGDTVVMVTDGLAHAHFQYGAEPLPMTAAPRLAMFCADESGAVKVAVNPNGGNGYGGQIYYDDFGGGRAIRGRVMLQGGMGFDGGYAAPASGAGAAAKKPLADVKFDAYDTTGRLIPRAEALKRLKAGGLVLLAGDNRFPDPEYLKAFREDLLVLVSSEFVFPVGAPNPYDMPVKPAPADPAKPAAQPAPPVAVPAIGVAVPAQVKVAPAVIKQGAVQVAPAKEAPAEKPAEKPTEKPAEKKPEPKPAEKP